MPRLEFNGGEYSGYDPGEKRPVYAVEGDVVEVSEEKAAQLLTDFPGDWAQVGVKVEEPEAEEPECKRKPRGTPGKTKPAAPEHTKDKAED